MKKYLALSLIFVFLCSALVGCRRNTDPSTTAGTSSLQGKALHQIVEGIYQNHPMELPLSTIDVDLGDSYAVKAYLGLDSADKVAEAALLM